MANQLPIPFEHNPLDELTRRCILRIESGNALPLPSPVPAASQRHIPNRRGNTPPKNSSRHRFSSRSWSRVIVGCGSSDTIDWCGSLQ